MESQICEFCLKEKQTRKVKQHIFYCKCAGKKLDFEEAICKIESIFEIERYNASVQGLRKKHEAKWSCYHSPEKPIKLSSKESTKYNTHHHAMR